MQASKLIAAIDQEIAKLKEARSLLAGTNRASTSRGAKPTQPATGFPFGVNGKAATRKKRKMSAEGRARIAAAQKARWAKAKKATKDKK